MVGSWLGPVLIDVAIFSSSSTCSATGPGHNTQQAAQVGGGGGGLTGAAAGCKTSCVQTLLTTHCCRNKHPLHKAGHPCQYHELAYAHSNPAITTARQLRGNPAQVQLQAALAACSLSTLWGQAASM